MRSRLMNGARCGFLLLIMSGCMTPTPNANNNSNSSSNNNGNSNGGSNLVIADSQKPPINSVVAALEDLGGVFAGMSVIASPNVDFGNLPQGIVLTSLNSTCPESFAIGNDTPIIISFSFGAGGCSSERTDDKTFQGDMALTLDRPTSTATLSFTSFSIAGVAVSGTASVMVSGNATNGVQLQGNFNLTIGSTVFSGPITAVVRTGGQITLNSAGLTVNDGSGALLIVLDDVVINAIANNAFVPSSGSATFSAGSDSITVTFTGNTPINGEVQVTINGAGPATYQVPGVPS